MNNIIIIFIIILKLMFVINLSNFKKRYSKNIIFIKKLYHLFQNNFYNLYIVNNLLK